MDMRCTRFENLSFSLESVLHSILKRSLVTCVEIL